MMPFVIYLHCFVVVVVVAGLPLLYCIGSHLKEKKKKNIVFVTTSEHKKNICLMNSNYYERLDPIQSDIAVYP